MLKIRQVLLCLLLGVASIASAQSKQITGQVTYEEDGDPIPGVSILVKGTNGGTITDNDGNYTISVSGNDAVLVFSFIGMESQEKAVGSASTINVVMTSTTLAMDEVMVVAYGTAKKESFTGSAKVISREKMERRVATGVSKSLEGQIAGVQSSSGSGQPGSEADIIIRGFGSINSSNAPLYVVDGVPYDGNLNAISSSDIESVTVLKDASAGALYGSRGANGVILITTKKGKEGKTSVEFKTSIGFVNRAIKPYKTMNSNGFIETAFQGYKNEFIYKKGMDPSIAGEEAIKAMAGSSGIFGDNEEYNFYDVPVSQLIDPITGKISPNATLAGEYSWLDEITNENALRQEYQILINGGTDKNKVFSSFSYLDEEGILATTNFERFTGRIGAELNPKTWFKYGANANFARNRSDYLKSTNTETSNVWYSAQFMAPIYPVYVRDRNTKLILSETGEKQFDYGPNRPSGASPDWNPISTLYKDTYSTESDNLSGRFHADLLGDGISSKIKGLSISTNLGFDYVNTIQTSSYNPNEGDYASVNGRINKQPTRKFSYTWNQLARYERKFGDHSINALLGHEYYSYKRNYLEGEKTGFPFADIMELAPGTTTTNLTSYEDNYTVESYLSNLSYNFKDRYYLSASFRTDGSSRFKDEYRWGDFWSVGGSWRMSEERFMSNIDQINNFTIKASYGVQGNDNIGDKMYYAWQSFYDLDWPNSSLGGALLSSLGNEEIKWEENYNLNIGIETRIFDIANITIEYYNRKTKDMLMERPIALSLGFDSYWDNIGEMLNTGIEFSTTVDIIKTANLEWSATLNVATLKNEILKLDGEKKSIPKGNFIQKEGEEINSFFMATSAGVDPTNGAPLYWVWDTDVKDNKGPKYITDDKNKAVTCKEIQGSRIPDFYGSFGSDFILFNNFDASFLTTFSVGGKVYDYVYKQLMNPNYMGSNYHENLNRAWKQPGDITDIPRVENGSVFDRTTTDNNLINASYFAIKNITIGYTLPKNVLSKYGFEKVRLYATLDNLATFSYLQGMNPQYNFTGSTNFVYSPVKTTLFGLDIKF